MSIRWAFVEVSDSDTGSSQRGYNEVKRLQIVAKVIPQPSLAPHDGYAGFRQLPDSLNTRQRRAGA